MYALWFMQSREVPPRVETPTATEESVTEETALPAVDVRVSALTAHPWVWQETLMNDDTRIVPQDADAFVLTFTDEGKMTGATDCNSFGGSYSVTDGLLTMGPFFMTKMYCEGSQEMEFQGMLDEPVTFMFTDAGELVLMLPYDSGSVIFTPKI